MAIEMTKVTFTLDAETVARLRRTAARLSRPQSQVVREAIRDYDERSGTLSEDERRRLLEVFDRVVPAIRPRPARDVDAELKEIGASRRAGSLRRARSAGR
ncbi:MAG: ribbon-helix-helix protein, CopG family [Candidatus Rokubacteria bacterium]|nr:ribbon-helix-helix protein, CopG family [Candidatus Rokubacteria bacterium]MBI3106335.1 ribbon-helix-helix protein, CopG family [Candidatus Rokubacteria bacterium]